MYKKILQDQAKNYEDTENEIFTELTRVGICSRVLNSQSKEMSLKTWTFGRDSRMVTPLGGLN